ncbi:LysR family transcriptional regulator [Anopheles sinensis]|uniref:LysR family transcriptional regulator n=1 Tax=Anopheles sinensis TaxID=74873 RepID=A0A084VJ30_ANOSI|nr:LysR family transcriptional regulator [Anopheles sinensis]
MPPSTSMRAHPANDVSFSPTKWLTKVRIKVVDRCRTLWWLGSGALAYIPRPASVVTERIPACAIHPGLQQ